MRFRLLLFGSEQDLRRSVPARRHVIGHNIVTLSVVGVLHQRPRQSKVGYFAPAIGVQ